MTQLFSDNEQQEAPDCSGCEVSAQVSIARQIPSHTADS